MPVTVYDNNDNEKNILIVAPESWRANINDRIPGLNCNYSWSGNVFDALATIVSTNTLPRPLVAVILIDALNSDEMNLFKHVSRYPDIISIGVTAFAGRRKLDQALLLGASQAVSVMELPEILKMHQSTIPPEPDDAALEKDDHKIKKLLSDNEIDSLLGD